METQELSPCAVYIAPPAQVQRQNSSTLQHLQVGQLEQGVVLDGTLVRLRDIWDSIQLGLVKCMEEMELSDHKVSIQFQQVGQLVAFVLQTRVARA